MASVSSPVQWPGKDRLTDRKGPRYGKKENRTSGQQVPQGAARSACRERERSKASSRIYHPALYNHRQRRNNRDVTTTCTGHASSLGPSLHLRPWLFSFAILRGRIRAVGSPTALGNCFGIGVVVHHYYTAIAFGNPWSTILMQRWPAPPGRSLA